MLYQLPPILLVSKVKVQRVTYGRSLSLREYMARERSLRTPLRDRITVQILPAHPMAPFKPRQHAPP